MAAASSPLALHTTEDELGFFDRAKKFIGNRTDCGDFMTLINLFSNGHMDNIVLCELTKRYLTGELSFGAGSEFHWHRTTRPAGGREAPTLKRKRSTTWGEAEQGRQSRETYARELPSKKQKTVAPSKEKETVREQEFQDY